MWFGGYNTSPPPRNLFLVAPLSLLTINITKIQKTQDICFHKKNNNVYLIARPSIPNANRLFREKKNKLEFAKPLLLIRYALNVHRSRNAWSSRVHYTSNFEGNQFFLRIKLPRTLYIGLQLWWNTRGVFFINRTA